MIKVKDFKKVQKLMMVRDTANKAWNEVYILSEVVSRKETIEKKQLTNILEILFKIREESIDKLREMIDWSDEE